MRDRTLLYYWLILYRRKWMVLFTALSSTVFAYFFSQMLPPIYEAKAVFFVPSAPNLVSFAGDSATTGLLQVPLFPTPDDDVAGLYLGLLASRNFREEVAKKFPQKTANEIGRDADFVMSVHYYIEIFARDKDPQLAADIANEFYHQFNRFQNTVIRQQLAETRRTLQEAIDRTQTAAGDARRELAEFQKSNQLLSVALEAKQLMSRQSRLLQDLNASLVQLGETEQKIRSTEEQMKFEQALYVPGELVSSSPLIELLQLKLTEILVKIAALTTELTADHPDVLATQAQYDETRARIEEEFLRIVSSQSKEAGSLFENLRRSLVATLVERQTLEARVRTQRESLDVMDWEVERFPSVEIESGILERRIAEQDRRLITLLEKKAEVLSQESWKKRSGVLVDAASPPPRPAYPILLLNLLVGGVLGLIVGILYVFFLEYVQDVVRASKLERGDWGDEADWMG